MGKFVIPGKDCKHCTATAEVVLHGKKCTVDFCLAEILQALNSRDDIVTTSSCCGHGLRKASFIAMVNEQYVFFEIDLQTPLKTWAEYRPFHEAGIGEKKRCTE